MTFAIRRKLSTLFVAGLLTVATTGSAHAFLTCTTDPGYLGAGNAALATMTSAMLTLSGDIGEMADRILATEDKIGEMADRIGVMADRIVTTEQLLADTLLQLQRSDAARNRGVLLLSPATGDSLARATPPTIALSEATGRYVLYVSDRPDATAAQTVPVLITPTTDRALAWNTAVAPFPGATVFLAVRSISDNLTQSELSNWVRVNLR